MGDILSGQDYLFIYGRFKNDIKRLEELKANPNNPIAKSTINQDIKLLSQIVDKIQKAYPQLMRLP